ncbi:hypothetical protein ES703_51385 [subsurface metagenome]
MGGIFCRPKPYQSSSLLQFPPTTGAFPFFIHVHPLIVSRGSFVAPNTHPPRRFPSRSISVHSRSFMPASIEAVPRSRGVMYLAPSLLATVGLQGRQRPRHPAPWGPPRCSPEVPPPSRRRRSCAAVASRGRPGSATAPSIMHCGAIPFLNQARACLQTQYKHSTNTS